MNFASEEELQQVLNANRELVDAGLVQMMRQVAEGLENRNAADFLNNLARQLAELLGRAGNVAAENTSSTATPEEYDNFLMQVLQVTSESQGNPEIVYPFLRQNLNKLNLNFSSTIQQWWQNTLPNIEASQRNYLAAFVFELGNLFQQFPFKKHICLEISIAYYQLALQEWRQDNVPLNWAATQNNLAAAYSQRIEGDRRENLEQAIACYQLALQERRQDNVPLDWATTQHNLATAYSDRIAGDRRENLEQAIACYELALQERRQDNVPLDCIEWYFTDKEILTFITTKHDQQPLVKLVSSFDEFRKLMFEYLDLYLTNKQKWRTQLPSLLSKFAQILNLEEIIRSLKEKYSQITLIPHLYLHLLPLHAFPLTDGKCLLDHFEQVKYAPSCQLLQLIKNRPPQGFTNLFGIQNPTQDLRYTDIEVETISQIFKPHDDLLIKEEATKTALKEKPLEKQHYSHFSCHGYFNFNKPLDSALILAGAKVEQNGNRTLPNQLNEESLPEKFIRSSEGETIDLEKCLTLGDVFELDLRQCRLVTLSACETAITDIKSTSDEYISLPSGFLFAGACNVVATQWTVNDLSTAILMIKFYQLHKIDGLPVAKAMNEAQKWLRDGTQEVFWSWTEQLKNHLKLKQDFIKQIQRYLRKFGPEEQPFNELFYWAAFCAIGK
ncbi:MAG: CHAT domain-containing protein [Xenococcaceae cyanobacterium MO_207.B15]|nr:CHAT domain-containing protein [Xenococcaceae cyanobacterium MO_207.B15]